MVCLLRALDPQPHSATNRRAQPGWLPARLEARLLPGESQLARLECAPTEPSTACAAAETVFLYRQG